MWMHDGRRQEQRPRGHRRHRRLLLSLALLALLVGAGIFVWRQVLPASDAERCAAMAQAASRTPPLYLGLAAYRHLDQLAYLEVGDRVMGQSTADINAHNADSSHYLRTLPGGGRVLFDASGPGLLTFMRMQESYGAPWTLNVDGRQTEVSATDLGQRQPAEEPARLFPYPLSLTPSEDEGSSIIALPIAFQQRLQWSSSRPNGNFYALYRRLPYSALPVACQSDPSDAPAVAALLQRSGSAIASTPLRRHSGQLTLRQNRLTPVITLTGPRQIRALTFRASLREQVALANARLLIYWDGQRQPAVAAPLKFLAGDGAGVYQPAGRPLVRGWLAGIHRVGRQEVEFDLYWPMPFRAQARIALQAATNLQKIAWSLGDEAFPDPPAWWGTFHATYTSTAHPPQGEDMTFLDVHGSGKLVGTVVNFWRPDGTLEGNPSFYIDDSFTPQIEVTGTEEWGLGGDYWRGGQQTSLPLGGLPSSQNNPRGSDHDGAALYRFLVADSIPFNRHLIVRWAHGSADQTTYPYRALMLWYGTPQVTARLSDELQPGFPASRLSHAYQASDERLYTLRAGILYQRQSSSISALGSATHGSVNFTLHVDPHNAGAFLRRTFDYCSANQRAAVYVDGTFAGFWYSAGGASSNGDAADHNPRCWRDEDFPLPATLTAGKSTLSLHLVFSPLSDAPATAWTAFTYQIYSFAL